MQKPTFHTVECRLRQQTDAKHSTTPPSLSGIDVDMRCDMRCGVLVIPYGDHLGGDPVISMYGYRSVPYTVWPCPYMDLAVLISDSGQL